MDKYGVGWAKKIPRFLPSTICDAVRTAVQLPGQQVMIYLGHTSAAETVDK